MFAENLITKSILVSHSLAASISIVELIIIVLSSSAFYTLKHAKIAHYTLRCAKIAHRFVHRAATFASQNDVKCCHHNFRGSRDTEISMVGAKRFGVARLFALVSTRIV